MRSLTLVRRSLVHYWRTNLAVVFGVATAVAVLSGALLVGESVRASLRDLVLQRLGRTAYVISAARFFDGGVAADMSANPRFLDGFDAAVPIVVLSGFVSDPETGRQAGGVQVYGVDDRFWAFHDVAEGAVPRDRDALLSPSLANELDVQSETSLLLRVEMPSDVPEESLHGRRDEAARTIRLSAQGVLPVDRLGEFSIRPQQGAVRAIFLSLDRLQQDLGQADKVNAILLAAASSADAEEGSGVPLAEDLLRETLELSDYGVTIRSLDRRRALAIESDSGLIPDGLVEEVGRLASRLDLAPTPVLTYLANSIGVDERRVPYSLITAVDLEAFLGTPVEQTGSQPPIVLNDWAAHELEAVPGDRVQLDYYVWLDEGRLTTRRADFTLVGIAPLEGVAADPDLAPTYRGISEVARLSAWDPPFPIDLSLVRPVDEAYWDDHRTTPKAFIPLEAGQALWGSRYGQVTSVRLAVSPDDDLATRREEVARELRITLSPAAMGFGVWPARAEGLRASGGVTDFGEYFTYFSFFLVVSALLLTVLFFRLGLEQRLKQVGLLRALGFPARRIRDLFVMEGLVLAAVGAVLGTAGAVGFAELMMYGLRTWWVGAVGTTLLRLHPSGLALGAGALGGLITATACTAWTLRGMALVSPRNLLAGTLTPTGSPRLSRKRAARWPLALFGLASLSLGASAAGLIEPAAGFFGGGLLLLVAALGYLGKRLRADRRSVIRGLGWWAVARLGFRSVTYRPGRTVLSVALIASATFIIVAVDAFRKSDQDLQHGRDAGTGGFSLLAESVVPVFHDPGTSDGQELLNLVSTDALPEGLGDARVARFRLRPGDDASCLNLYQPRNPRILGVTEGFVEAGGFGFRDLLEPTAAEALNPWRLLDREIEGGVIPVIADATSMTYALHVALGDEMTIDVGGTPTRLRFVGALADSVFQSELLMAERHFVRLFPDLDGYRFFLIDAPGERAELLTGYLEAALSDFGVDVIATDERLASYHRVENTYLSTFQTLGGLGLVLGTVGLSTVLLRNVLERRQELALLRAVGYDSKRLALLILSENAWMLCCGLGIGVGAALLAIAPVVASRGGHLPAGAFSVLLPAVAGTGLVASLLATRVALRAPLLSSLRAE